MCIPNTHRKEKNQYIPFLYLMSVFNIVLGPFISRWNGFVDELIVLLLFIFGYRSLNFKKNKELYIAAGILTFFLIYSLARGENIYKAAILDFLLFTKPIISFFLPYFIPFQISENQKKIFRSISFLLCFVCLLQLPYISDIYENTTHYYPCCIISAMSYLFFSRFAKNDWLFFFLFLTPGLAAIRAKFFTEYIFAIFIVFFLRERIKINFKWVLRICLIAVVAIYVNIDKFVQYFIIGVDEKMARTMTYFVVPSIIVDYFPLGPGFGTFNTEAAAQFYSPLYIKYDLDNIYGLSESDYRTESDFLHDTFYPVLAQFGILGFFFYGWFWLRRWYDSYALDFNYYRLFIIIFFIMVIENIAANSFTGPECIPYMMLLGMMCCSKKHKIHDRNYKIELNNE